MYTTKERQVFFRNFQEIKHDAKVFGAKMRNNIPYNKNGAYNMGDINGLIDLVDYINMNPTWRMVEVGSYYGASSVIFATTGVKIDCIDAWSDEVSDIIYDTIDENETKLNVKITEEDFKYIESLFDANTEKYFCINKIKGNAKLLVHEYEDNSLDCVYIDANHNYADVRDDIEKWYPKIKNGGWLCGHDITLKGVTQAVTEKFQLFPHTFKDSSWAIKKEKDFKNNVDLYLVTGVTENYLEKAMKYLVSLNAYNNVSFIKKTCITLGFYAPKYLQDSLPTIQFIYKEMNSQISPNKNNCMQHGEFLSDLDAKDDDIIVFTDGDIIIQDDFNVHQAHQMLACQIGETYLSFNQNSDDTLYKEYLRLKNHDSQEADFQMVSNNILEQLLNFNSMDYKCYNTGVFVSTKKTYLEIFNKYCELFPVIDKVFNHYAKQQYLLCYIVQKHFKVNTLNKGIHTHGHAGIPYWTIYNYKNQTYEISANEQGYNVPDENKLNPLSTKIIFRHNLWDQKIVIGILNAEKSGCGAAYYRISTPYETLQKKYAYKYELVYVDLEKTDLKLLDIIVCQRAMNAELYFKIKNSIKENAKIVWDGDDDYFSVDDRNPNTEAFNDPKLILGIKSFIHNSDLVTTSTQYLKEVYAKERTKNIEIFANGLDYKLWDKNFAFKKKNRKNDGYIRIGWQGGDSHTKDMRNVYTALMKIMNEFDNVILCVVGWDFSGFSEFLRYKDRVEHIGWATYHERYIQNIIDFDIGIAPLDQNMLFNKSKSNIKWLEYSALEIPTIASNELPYQEIIHNKTGLIIDNDGDNWYNSLLELINDEPKRKFLGYNAKIWTRERYNVINLVDKMDEVYSEIFNIKKG